MFNISHPFIHQPKFDQMYKVLGKYDNLFNNINVYSLTKVPPGWIKIIEDLSFTINQYLKYYKDLDFKFLDIKEENGSLIIDVQNSDKVIDLIVSKTKDQAQKTCSECGGLGSLNIRYQKVFCPKHLKIE